MVTGRLLWGYKSKKDLDSLSGSSKEQLKAIADKSPRIHHFFFENPVQYRGSLTDAVRRVLEGLEMLKLYPTYEEASSAAKALGVQTKEEYMMRRSEDPHAQYGEHFLGTDDFFGKSVPEDTTNACLLLIYAARGSSMSKSCFFAVPSS